MNSTTENIIFDILTMMKQRRKLILTVTLIFFLVSIGISLLLKNQYQSSVIILPDTNQNSLMGLSGLSEIASIAGLGAGDASYEKLYPSLLQSESILKEVIYHKYLTHKFRDSVNLIAYYEIEEDSELISYELMLKKLRKMLKIEPDAKTNVLTISLETEEANLSSDILNTMVRVLDNFIRTKNRTNASEQRLWIEKRLVQVEKDLKQSEDSLTNFRKNNRIISLSPELMLTQQRLMRDTEINNAIFLELTKRYELAKIDEVKNIPILNILDNAREAGKKISPSRSIIVVISTFFGFLIISMAVYVKQKHSIVVDNYIAKIKELW